MPRCREVAGARKPRALAGQSPWEVLAAVERPAMVPLPPRRLEPAEWRTATVGSHHHASVKGVLYSVPYQLVGARLDVRLSATTVEFHLDVRSKIPPGSPRDVRRIWPTTRPLRPGSSPGTRHGAASTSP